MEGGGLIVNTATNRVICVPPVKSIQKEMEWFLQDGFQSPKIILKR